MDSNDLISLGISVLSENRYRTRIATLGEARALVFEDETLLGGLHVFPTAKALVEMWRETEMRFLVGYSKDLRIAGEKAWNVYSVFITSADATPMERRQIRRIEEDLEHTRKLAMHSVLTRQTFINSVLPLLPLQQKPILQTESYEHRLFRRVSGLVSVEAGRAVKEGAKTEDLLRLLRDLP